MFPLYFGLKNPLTTKHLHVTLEEGEIGATGPRSHAGPRTGPRRYNSSTNPDPFHPLAMPFQPRETVLIYTVDDDHEPRFANNASFRLRSEAADRSECVFMRLGAANFEALLPCSLLFFTSYLYTERPWRPSTPVS